MIDGDLTELQTAATALHELFIAYLDAGFTEPQALQLVCAMSIANVRPPDNS